MVSARTFAVACAFALSVNGLALPVPHVEDPHGCNTAMSENAPVAPAPPAGPAVPPADGSYTPPATPAGVPDGSYTEKPWAPEVPATPAGVLDGSYTEKPWAPEVPAPAAPAPEGSYSAAPMPVPAPEVPAPEVPAPVEPTPDAPVEPTPVEPTSEVPAPAASAPGSGYSTAPEPGNGAGAVSQITAEQIIAAAPETASCDGAKFPDECADAARAALSLNKAFEKYEITTPGAQAAVLGLILLESGNFKYNKNHFPGRPGQGTRNMQMPEFNEEYATDLLGADKVATAKAEGGVDGVLKLVWEDDPSFGSAAWYMNKKCSADVKAGLADGSEAGFKAYLVDCINTEEAPERITIWEAAKKALGV